MKYIYTFLVLIIFASCSQDQKSAEVQANFNKIEVEEVLQTSSYTYLFGKVNGESLWLATLKLNASAGDTFYYEGGLEMIDFNSPELDRVFESVIFLEGVYNLGIYISIH